MTMMTKLKVVRIRLKIQFLRSWTPKLQRTRLRKQFVDSVEIKAVEKILF